jgi:hypothetical protein
MRVRSGFAARRHHLRGGRRSQPVHFFRRRHHHRRLRAAVHPVRNRRPHFRTDGQDLRLRDRRRLDRDLHHRAGLEPADVSAASSRSAKPWWCAGCAASTSRRWNSRWRIASSPLRLGADRAAGVHRRAFTGPGIPAQAGGRQSVGARHLPAIDIAGGQRYLRESACAADEQISGSGIGGVAARPARRRHRRHRLSSMPSSSCR